MIYSSENPTTIFNNALIMIQYVCFTIFFIMFCVILYFKKYKKERYAWINNMKKHISWNKIIGEAYGIDDETCKTNEEQLIIDDFEEL